MTISTGRSQHEVIPLVIPPGAAQPYWAYWLDDPSDVSCKETTREDAVDDPLLSCNRRLQVRVLLGDQIRRSQA